MNFLNAPQTMYGLKVYVQPDQPRMQLGASRCRLSDGTEFDWITPAARAETNTWLRGFFGITNLLKDGEYIVAEQAGFVTMNPRTLQQLRAALTPGVPVTSTEQEKPHG